MRVLEGTAVGIDEPVLARVAKSPVAWWARRNHVVVSNQGGGGWGYSGHITSASPRVVSGRGVADLSPAAVEELGEGDVVLLARDGTVRQLWDADSRDNVILVSNECNCRCMMCPQPLERDPSDILVFNTRLMRLAASKGVGTLAMTGGEPTLRLGDLCRLLRLSRTSFPNACVAILTNGRAYRDERVVAQVAAVRHPDLVHCVSLHADAPTLNDQLAGSRGAFDDVVLGLQNLARHWQRVEIRVVVNRLNAARLPQIAEFIYRNFPFVCHVAFMGLEVTARAAENLDRIWIEPRAYGQALRQAIRELKRRDLEVSVYNVPLCLLPCELHSYSRDSISDWKKRFLPVCTGCSAAATCCGVFGTSARHSLDIHPLTA